MPRMITVPDDQTVLAKETYSLVVFVAGCRRLITSSFRPGQVGWQSNMSHQSRFLFCWQPDALTPRGRSLYVNR